MMSDKVYDNGSSTAPTSASVVPQMPSAQVTSIPRQMMPNAVDEEQVSRVETVMLRPVQHIFQNQGSGKSVFRLERKGVLDSHSTIIFQVWNPSRDAPETDSALGSTGITGTQCAPPRLSGMCPISKASLYIGGVLVDSLEEVQLYLAISRSMRSQQWKSCVGSVKHGSLKDFSIDTRGNILYEEPEGFDMNAKTRLLGSDRSAEFCIQLRELFPSLNDIQLPLFLSTTEFPEVVIEIEWITDAAKVMSFVQDAGALETHQTLTVGAATGFVSGEEVYGRVGGKAGLTSGASLIDVNPAIANQQTQIQPDAGGGDVQLRGRVWDSTTVGVIQGDAVLTDRSGRNLAVADTITWQGVGSNAGGIKTFTTAVASVVDNTSATRTMNIPLPTMMCDHIHYPDAQEEMMRQRVIGGLPIMFRSEVLIRKQIPVVTTATESSQDIQIGQAGRFVQRVMVQKLSTAIASGTDAASSSTDDGRLFEVVKDCRSDLQQQENIDLIVNNRHLTDRPISNECYAYSLTNQSVGDNMLTLEPTQYGVLYDSSEISDNVSEISSEGVRDGAARGCQYTYPLTSGHSNWKAMQLSRYANGQISPMNATRIGATPIVLRYTRTGGSGALNRNNLKNPLQFLVWVSYVKQAIIQDGSVEIIDF